MFNPPFSSKKLALPDGLKFRFLYDAGVEFLAPDMGVQFLHSGARKAFEKGNKVKASIRFKGRQIAHPELAKEVLDRFYEKVSDVSDIETKPKIEGRTMYMMLAPKK